MIITTTIRIITIKITITIMLLLCAIAPLLFPFLVSYWECSNSSFTVSCFLSLPTHLLPPMKSLLIKHKESKIRCLSTPIPTESVLGKGEKNRLKQLFLPFVFQIDYYFHLQNITISV